MSETMLAVTSGIEPTPEQFAKVADYWVEMRSDVACQCGKSATIIHMREVAGLDTEITAYCENCSPVVWLKPFRFPFEDVRVARPMHPIHSEALRWLEYDPPWAKP